MARQPEVFVPELDPAEKQGLVKITRTARDRVRLRRSGVVLASAQGRGAAEDVRRHRAVRAGGDPRVQRSGVRGAGATSVGS